MKKIVSNPARYTYTVRETETGAWAVYRGDELVGSRPKYKVAQRLAEATAGRQLDWLREGRTYVGE